MNQKGKASCFYLINSPMPSVPLGFGTEGLPSPVFLARKNHWKPFPARKKSSFHPYRMQPACTMKTALFPPASPRTSDQSPHHFRSSREATFLPAPNQGEADCRHTPTTTSISNQTNIEPFELGRVSPHWLTGNADQSRQQSIDFACHRQDSSKATNTQQTR